MLNIHAVSAFNDNYIWFIQAENSQHVLIVDPGDAEPVIKAIKQQGLIPVALLITHGCHDHVDGINELLTHYKLPVYGPKNEFIPSITAPLSACDELVISPLFPPFKIVDIPGHTKGHIGFLIEGNLFCGDTVFGAGCGRLHGNPAKLLFQSLKQIAQLPLDLQIYCAHEYTQDNLRFAATVEPNNADIQKRIIDTKQLRKKGKATIPFSLGLEHKTNPFIRCDRHDVIQSTQIFANKNLITEEDIFTHLRLWKNEWV